MMNWHRDEARRKAREKLQRAEERRAADRWRTSATRLAKPVLVQVWKPLRRILAALLRTVHRFSAGCSSTPLSRSSSSASSFRMASKSSSL